MRLLINSKFVLGVLTFRYLPFTMRWAPCSSLSILKLWATILCGELCLTLSMRPYECMMVLSFRAPGTPTRQSQSHSAGDRRLPRKRSCSISPYPRTGLSWMGTQPHARRLPSVDPTAPANPSASYWLMTFSELVVGGEVLSSVVERPGKVPQ